MKKMLSPIDWQECLRLNNNKPHIAQEILGLLEKDLLQMQQNIQTAQQQNDWKNIAFHLHKLHGACCYCGVPQLKNLVETLENNIKTQALTRMSEQLTQLHIEIERVITAIKEKNY